MGRKKQFVKARKLVKDAVDFSDARIRAKWKLPFKVWFFGLFSKKYKQKYLDARESIHQSALKHVSKQITTKMVYQ